MRYIKRYENYKADNICQFEYQFRDIDTGIWYKRKKGDILWTFTTEEDYMKNSIKENIVNS